MLMIKDFGNVSIDCQVNILIKYKKIWDKSRFRSSNLLALSIPKLGEVSHKARFESASQIDIGKLLPVNVITQYHASIIGNVPTRFRLAQTEEDMNNLILCFSVLVRVIALKTNQIRRQKDIIVMNSNESNKTNKRLLHRLIKPRHLNIPSNLVACFMGNCGPADESVVNLISESYCDQSDTSIGFPSSIFESRSNSWLCQLGLLRQPSEDENLFILHVNPTYEQDPLAFCQIFKPNVQEGAMVIYVDKRKKNVIEIECNIDGVESKLQTEVEIISSGQFKHRKKSILKKAGEKVSKHYPPLQLTFAPARQLATVFEYPKEDVFFRNFDENNHLTRQNHNNQSKPSLKSVENGSFNYGPVLWKEALMPSVGNHIKYSFSY